MDKFVVPLDQASVREVTVFNDRAEITREVVVTQTTPGSLEICVEGLTSRLDADSIRVKPAPGCHQLTIVEVSFEVREKVTKEGEADPSRVGAKRAEIHALSTQATSIEAEIARAKEARELVRGYLKARLMPGAHCAVEVAGLDDTAALLRFHGEQCARLDEETQRLTGKLSEVNEAIELLRKDLMKLEGPVRTPTTTSRDVSVLVNIGDGASKAGDVRLLLTYMVSGASWSPSYDIRVDTLSESAELALSYFGLVVNSSGEDWTGCHLALSTAKPSKAGMPLAPPRRLLRFEELSKAPRKMMKSKARRSIPMQAVGGLERKLSFDALEAASSCDDDDLDAIQLSTVAAGGAGTAAFNIERLVSIAADAKPHKVTIAMLTFQPELLYFGTPSLEQAFYLQVKAANTSSFPLLASSKVSVFLDGSFVTTTQLKDVSPSEEFTTFLGVDSALKLEHQQLALERKGESWRNKKQTTTHKYIVKIHNTKAVPVRLKVVEVLPKSTEQQISVELHAPAPKELKDEPDPASGESVTQNKVTNNIVWQLTLQPGKKRELAFEYAISWPADKELCSFDSED